MDLRQAIIEKLEVHPNFHLAPVEEEGLYFGGHMEVDIDVDSIMGKIGKVLEKELKLKQKSIRENEELENDLSVLWEQLMGEPYLGNMTPREKREWGYGD